MCVCAALLLLANASAFSPRKTVESTVESFTEIMKFRSTNICCDAARCSKRSTHAHRTFASTFCALIKFRIVWGDMFLTCSVFGVRCSRYDRVIHNNKAFGNEKMNHGVWRLHEEQMSFITADNNKEQRAHDEVQAKATRIQCN